jgi:hypothetical protein
LPSDAPVLTPGAARVLLRIIEEAAERERTDVPQPPEIDREPVIDSDGTPPEP